MDGKQPADAQANEIRVYMVRHTKMDELDWQVNIYLMDITVKISSAIRNLEPFFDESCPITITSVDYSLHGSTCYANILY